MIDDVKEGTFDSDFDSSDSEPETEGSMVSSEPRESRERELPSPIKGFFGDREPREFLSSDTGSRRADLWHSNAVYDLDLSNLLQELLLNEVNQRYTKGVHASENIVSTNIAEEQVSILNEDSDLTAQNSSSSEGKTHLFEFKPEQVQSSEEHKEDQNFTTTNVTPGAEHTADEEGPLVEEKADERLFGTHLKPFLESSPTIEPPAVYIDATEEDLFALGVINSETHRKSRSSTLKLQNQHSQLEQSRLRSRSMTIGSTVSSVTGDQGLRVAFDAAVSSRRASKINLALPEPTELKDTQVYSEKEHHNFMKRFRLLAQKSKGKALVQKSNLKLKMYRSILRSYKTGDIIRMDKMLVLVKFADNVTKIGAFSESEPCDTRIYERWKEYIVVLRKTNDATNQLAIQLYSLHDVADDSHYKPAFLVELSRDVRAQLYSTSDRTISMTAPHEKGVIIYIFKPQFHILASKWLYFVMQMQNTSLSQHFDVSIPGLGVSSIIHIPMRKALEMLQKKEDAVFTVTEKGYTLQYCSFLQYVKDTLLEELRRSETLIPQVKQWFLENPNPWFCYKKYDRLEWLANDSERFYVEYQLFAKTFRLQFRQMEQNLLETKIGEKEVSEPIPVEGFVARLTNTTGSPSSAFRLFHKMLYFYTSDNMLFFTKYYRGVPPSPDNILMRTDKLAEIDPPMPDIYVKEPFEVDDTEHISWLNDVDFEKYDELALGEFERRAQQLVKSEAVIDLCLVKEVRKMPLSQLQKSHRLLQCILWYSDSALIDKEEVIDAGFEMELVNGSIVRLQAPNRHSRDYWVDSLTQIVEYWKHKTKEGLCRQLAIRRKNQKTLRIDEYVDSNMVLGPDFVEFKHSFADPKLHNVGALAMSNCVLMSGYLYEKSKKHSNFNQFYAVLCPGFMLLFLLYRRLKTTGVWKPLAWFEHYLTVPLSDCYIYLGITTSSDLLMRLNEVDPAHPGQHALPRVYPDGWKLSEEEPLRCFTLWFGKKRQISGDEIAKAKSRLEDTDVKSDDHPRNPGLASMVRKVGITGKSLVFMGRSRQERELWVQRISEEIDRFCKE